MRVNESGVGLALTGQTPILSSTKVTSLGSSVGTVGTIPTLGAPPSTGQVSNVVSLGSGNNSSNGVDMKKIMSGPPPAAGSAATNTSAPPPKKEPVESSIAVMTHEKRIYSNKVILPLF